MIPDGTPPEVIVLVVVTVVGVGLTMAAALFYFTLPRKDGLSLMSRWSVSRGPSGAGDARDRHLSPVTSHPIAAPSTAVTDKVTVTPGDVPPAAREIIYHEARAQAIADLIREGLLTNQAKAIEAVYHCTRTAASRSESPYQKAKKRVDELVNVQPLFYDDLRKRISDEVDKEIREVETA